MSEHRPDLAPGRAPGPAAVLLGSLTPPLPEPGCGCVRCRAAAASTHARAPNGLDLPGRLRVDGPERLNDPTPAAPDRNGRAGTPGTTGPDQVDGPVRLTTRRGGPGRWLTPGERLEHAGLRVLALPTADPDRCALVLAERGRTLLWAPAPGPLPGATVEALDGARLDVLALSAATPAVDASGEPVPGAVTGPLGLAHQLARLRATGAVAGPAQVVAVGLDHRTAPAGGRSDPGTAEFLAGWGVELLPDGTPLRLWPGDVPAPDPAPGPHRTVVLGAAASGKSGVAEGLLAAEPTVVYAATGPVPEEGTPAGPDPDWAARVRAHRDRRPPWWHTWEGHDLYALLAAPGPAVLVDSLGSWLAGALERSGCWQERPGWRSRLAQELDALVVAWRRTPRPVVAVAEEVGAGVVPATAAGRVFRDALGELTRRITAESERLLVVAAGRIVHRSGPAPGRVGTAGTAGTPEAAGVPGTAGEREGTRT